MQLYASIDQRSLVYKCSINTGQCHTRSHTHTDTEAINGYTLENIVLMSPRQTKTGKSGIMHDLM